MSLNIATDVTEKEAVIKLSGKLDVLGSPVLESELNAHMDGIDLLTLDFTDCDYVSSAGIRVIIGAWKEMEAKGGKIRMTNVGPQFTEVLKNIGLDEVIDRA